MTRIAGPAAGAALMVGVVTPAPVDVAHRAVVGATRSVDGPTARAGAAGPSRFVRGITGADSRGGGGVIINGFTVTKKGDPLSHPDAPTSLHVVVPAPPVGVVTPIVVQVTVPGYHHVCDPNGVCPEVIVPPLPAL
jgi:hypothetical protein